MPKIQLLAHKRHPDPFEEYSGETFEGYLEDTFIVMDICRNFLSHTDVLSEYKKCLDHILSSKYKYDNDLIILRNVYTEWDKYIKPRIPKRKLPENIEKPLNTLYKSISEKIDGLFYNIEKVSDRDPGYIINLLIVIPKKNYENERNVYKEIGSLMREYPHYLFDFSIVRREGRDIGEISEGYEGYVYP